MSLTGEKWASGIHVLVGLWLIVIPFWFGSSATQMWSGIISGVIIAVLGVYDFWLESQGTPANEWAAGIAGLFGLWVIVSAFVFPAGVALFWGDIVGGVVVAILAAYNIYDVERLSESTNDDRSTGV